jgi:siroheme synthase-like protein
MRVDAVGVPVTLDAEDARVVLVGGGDESDRKAQLCAEAGARVQRCDDPKMFHDALLDGAKLAMVTARDRDLAARVFAAARARGVLVWSCDDPAHSDIAMPGVARLGRARVTVSTAGASPTLAGRMRAAFEEALGDRFAKFVEVLGALRERTQREEPDPERRRAILTAALDGFALEIRASYPAWFK